MGLDFALKDTPPMGAEALESLRRVLAEALNEKS
jgi:hypothetical protein